MAGVAEKKYPKNVEVHIQESLKEHVKELLYLTPEEEKKILRKVDLWIIPYASLLVLLSFLDRVNIGQARLAGLEADLGLVGNQYDIALSIFFVSYVIFELPSNLALKKLNPQRWICFIMVCWSICQIFMGLVTNARGLYALRFCLGFFEAGLTPGLSFLLTTWYTRKELNLRISIYFSGITLGGAFGGILAFGIRHMAGVGGKNGWSWIFILEGLLTFVCAIPALWLIPGFPQYSHILSLDERARWLHRLNISQGVTNASLPCTKKQITRALTDWKTYVYSLMYLFILQPFYSLSLFAPSIIAALGYSNARANLLSAVPYLLGIAVTIIVAYFSDKYGVRTPFLCITMMLCIIGYTILLCDVSNTTKFVAVNINVAGASSTIATAITFVGNNFGPMYTRAIVMAVFFSFGNSAGIIASNIYPEKDAPRYIKGHTVALAFSALAIIFALFIGLYNYRENARRDRIYGKPDPADKNCDPEFMNDPECKKRWGLENMNILQILELGDRHPAFRYMI